MEIPTAIGTGAPIRDAEHIHVSAGDHDMIIVKFGTMTGALIGVEAGVILNHAEARLLRRRLKASLKGNPHPDQVQ